MLLVDELLLQMEPRKMLVELVVHRTVKYEFTNEREQLRNFDSEYRKVTQEWVTVIEALRIDNKFNRLLCKVSKNLFIGQMLLLQPTRRQYYLNYFIDKDLTAKVN